MKPVLRTVGLKKQFGAVVAAADINAIIPEQKIVGIIGANGAGKTTFVNMVTGYTKPTSGSIFFNEQNITGFTPIEIVRCGIGRSFQTAQLFNGLTVFENMLLAMGIAERGQTGIFSVLDTPSRADHAKEILRAFEIEKYLNQPIVEVSQGSRKLLDIAMALAVRPRLLLLDEPTSGVSSQEKTHLMNRIVTVVRDVRASVVLIEHDMDVVGQYADLILAFSQGGIVCEGPPQHVLNDPFVRSTIVGR
jgi:branched-chain amino acid transport system ATP-binding protein